MTCIRTVLHVHGGPNTHILFVSYVTAEFGLMTHVVNNEYDGHNPFRSNFVVEHNPYKELVFS